MKPYGKNGREINCCPGHDSTSKLRAMRSNKKRARQQSRRLLFELACEALAEWGLGRDTRRMTKDVNHYTIQKQKIEIPAKRELFDAQVLVMTLARTEMFSPYELTLPLDNYYPLPETQRVLVSKHFHAELILPAITNGKPMLIIYEDEDRNEKEHKG